MANPYQPFVNLPPIDLGKLVDDLRDLARMRSIEGAHPELATRQTANAILESVEPYILYVELKPSERPLDHVLQRIKSACRAIDLSEPGQLRECGRYLQRVSADDIQAVANRLAQVAGCADVSESNATATNEQDLGADDNRLSWQEAAERLERLRTQGEPYTSQSKLGTQIGCSPATINKAIQNTPSLRPWAKRGATPKAQSINAVVTDQTAQNREILPEDDAAIREYVESADAEAKAWFLALPTSEQLTYLNDPDSHKGTAHRRILGRKP